MRRPLESWYFVEETANGALAAVLLQPLDIDLDVEMAAVRDDGAVLHAREVLAGEEPRNCRSPWQKKSPIAAASSDGMTR